ncbi:hypothetical protein [Cyclobacterium xiamenense]|uniref:hypothetical protein n=1 Tax=Cyclobacterium xiamenense TaxID=1297121 RepID=UPI000B85AB5B|nr:hypothetical protein [Cyclobacterium xiamenense]
MFYSFSSNRVFARRHPQVASSGLAIFGSKPWSTPLPEASGTQPVGRIDRGLSPAIIRALRSVIG